MMPGKNDPSRYVIWLNEEYKFPLMASRGFGPAIPVIPYKWPYRGDGLPHLGDPMMAYVLSHKLSDMLDVHCDFIGIWNENSAVLWRGEEWEKHF